MKHIHHVFTSLLADTALAPLATRLTLTQHLNALQRILPRDMQEGLLFITYRAPKLLFCFKHPSYAYNFNHYKKHDVRYCLKHYASHFEAFLRHINEPYMSAFLRKVSIQGYVPKALLHTGAHNDAYTSMPSCYTFCEPSKGTFINHARNESLHQRFEELRALITTSSH